MRAMDVAHIAAEMAPLAKVGGLGDVLGSLPWAQAARGHRVTVVLPGYRWLRSREVPQQTATWGVGFAYAGQDVKGTARAFEREGVRVVVLEQPELFDRDAVYAEHGQPYNDNGLRFGWFAGAALVALAEQGDVPDVLFAHDWPGGLVPVFATEHERVRGRYAETATVQTIHNLAHQGLFPIDLAQGFDVASGCLSRGRYAGDGTISMLEGGVLAATKVLTVSPTYAAEIVGPEYGEGLEASLRARGDDLQGILNGIDVDAWNPATDPHLPTPFSLSRVEGKEECKASLQAELGFRERADLPLVGVVSRIDRQKGIDLISEVAPHLVELEAQLAVLGTGVPGLLDSLHGLAGIWRQSVAVVERFDEPLAHRIYAGSDFFLMPSRFEPCGLGQLIALRYGALPVVRKTGGLADTVRDLNAQPEAGTGFVFEAADVGSVRAGCYRAVDTFYRRPEAFRTARRRALAEDFSWNRSAALYDRLIEDAVRAARDRART
jgi:starch synthase